MDLPLNQFWLEVSGIPAEKGCFPGLSTGGNSHLLSFVQVSVDTGSSERSGKDGRMKQVQEYHKMLQQSLQSGRL